MNKRPRDEPPSTFASAPKYEFDAGGGYGGQGHSEERSSTRRLTDHYSVWSNQTLEERENSPIIHLKKLNNLLKSVLIQLFARPGDCVLDLACGKWDKAKIGYHVGVDIAKGSARLDEYLYKDAPFDICSCQVSGLALYFEAMSFQFS